MLLRPGQRLLDSVFYADSVRSTFMVVVTYRSAAMIEALGLSAKESAATLAENLLKLSCEVPSIGCTKSVLAFLSSY